MTSTFDDCYDSSWHLIPPDYVSNEEDYRQVLYIYPANTNVNLKKMEN